MKTAILIILLFIVGSCFAQKTPGESFIGAHYTGLVYRSEHHDVRPWNSGFGFTGHLGALPHFGLEIAWDKHFVQETRQAADTLYTYAPPISLLSLRLCYTQTHDKWSGQAFFGFGLLWEADEPRYLMPQLGARGMWHLTNHLSAYVTVYGSVRVFDRDDDSSPGHAPNAVVVYPPLDGRFFFGADAGIAYRGMFEEGDGTANPSGF